jgi:hypothetical protein
MNIIKLLMALWSLVLGLGDVERPQPAPAEPTPVVAQTPVEEHQPPAVQEPAREVCATFKEWTFCTKETSLSHHSKLTAWGICYTDQKDAYEHDAAWPANECVWSGLYDGNAPRWWVEQNA